MRLLVWQEQFWPQVGGIEVLARKLFSSLRERGYEICVVTRQDRLDVPNQGQYQGVAIYRYPIWAAVTRSDINQIVEIRRRIKELKRAFQPDLIHTNGLGPSVLFQLDTVDAHATPSLVTLHTTLKSVIPTRARQDALYKRTLLAASWVTCVSAAVLDEARQLVPEITPRSSVTYNGLGCSAPQPEPLSFDPPRLLCLGRLIRDKGFDVALKAFASLAGRMPGLRLVIAGDGAVRSSLEALAVELGIRDCVEFLGWVSPDRVPALVNSATLVVMPSRREGLPGVALEAALMARPVVATAVGGTPEIVLHQKTGLLVAQDDEEALAEAILYLLTHRAVATAFGHAARRRAQEVFSFERYVDAYDALYRKTLIRSAESPKDLPVGPPALT